jgi:UDP-GlcNAc:undecaprenyl-phosphate GlcNAc-1-phosphate transferase
MYFLPVVSGGLALIIAFTVTFYVTPLLISVAHKLKIVDHPDNNLKTHKQPTAYLGGVAVYVGFITALAITFPFANNMFLMLVGVSLLLFVGLIDDLIALQPSYKFFGQLIATFCFLKGGFYLKETFLFSTHSYGAFLFWLIISAGFIPSVINAINLVDVMDGLATTITLCCTASFLVMAYILSMPTVALLLWAFFGALLAFLCFNRPLALIYLGDAGSLFIGGFLAIVPFMLPWGTYQPYGFLTPLVILFIPLLEEGTLIIVRTYLGIPFYQGSPHHFSIYLRKKGWSVPQILVFVVALSFLLFLIALAFLTGLLGIISLVIALFLILTGWFLLIFS